MSSQRQVDEGAVSLAVPARPEYLRLVRLAAADCGTRAELSIEDVEDLRIAVRLAELREQRGMTQTELAAKIRTSPAVISRLERGQNVEFKTLKKVAAALDVRLTLEPLAS